MNAAVAILGSRAPRRTVAEQLTAHPEAWWYALAAVAWVVLVTRHTLSGHPPMPMPMHPTDGYAGHSADAIALAWAWWLVMAVAMMLPIAAPTARRVAAGSLWNRRQRALIEFQVGYLTVWAVLGVAVVSLATTTWPSGAPPSAVMIALLAAAGWQVSPPRRRILRRCGDLGAYAVRGWQADRDCFTLGCRAGAQCTVTCGATMIVMTLSHSLLLTASLALLLITERARGPNPATRAARPFEAICLTLLAAAAGYLTV